jgi:hypothetical protein
MRTSIGNTLFASLFLIACGGSVQSAPDAGSGQDSGPQPEASPVVEAGPDVDNGAPSTTYPAFNIDAPQVVNNGSGPVLGSPKVVPIYFGNDDTTFTAQLTTFLNALPTSTYWGPQVTEYGVGAITIATPIQLTESALSTIDDTAIQTWLTTKLGSDPSFPVPDANTVYAMFYPAGTTITLQSSTSCSSFGGYHNSVPYNSGNVAYAVLPRCTSFGSLTGINAVTGPASHEIIEASTDPYPSANQAYGALDDNHVIWELVLGGAEVGDMCAQFKGSFYVPTDIGFDVQRTWSDIAAGQGHNPCVPSDGTPYFNSMPVLTDSVVLGGGQLTTKGVNISVGQTSTVEVDLFSSAATQGPWTVTATDAATLMGSNPTLNMTWDRTTGLNGEKLHLTINVMAASQYGAAAFIIDSTLGSERTTWIGLVGNP